MPALSPVACEQNGGSTLLTDTADQTYLDDLGCGARYRFSARHWRRLVESGSAPTSVKFGRLSRWSLATLLEWERNGCRPIHSGKVGH